MSPRAEHGRAGLVVYRDAGALDSIDEYSRRLVAALEEQATPARYVAGGLPAAREQPGEPAWIVLQYNPFSYGRYGLSAGLLRDAAAISHRGRTLLAVCVHEPWTHVHDWRSTLMAAGQRAQLVALLRSADVRIGVTERIAGLLGPDAIHLPVGSNVTPCDVSPRDARARLGYGQELVVTLFGRSHPSRALEHARAAIGVLAADRGPRGVRVQNLGAGAPPLDAPAGVAVQTPGALPPAELSLRLRATDIALLPFTDGLSTRRTTLMAALAHGVPVAGLCGAGTDAALVDRPDALLMAPADRPADYARAVVELTADPGRLRAIGDGGRRLYERRFAWPVIAERLLAALEQAPRAR